MPKFRLSNCIGANLTNIANANVWKCLKCGQDYLCYKCKKLTDVPAIYTNSSDVYLTIYSSCSAYPNPVPKFLFRKKIKTFSKLISIRSLRVFSVYQTKFKSNYFFLEQLLTAQFQFRWIWWRNSRPLPRMPTTFENLTLRVHFWQQSWSKKPF